MRRIINLGVIMMDKEKIIKIAGMGLSVIGMGLQIATGMLEDRKLDIKIAKEISKQLKK